MSVLPERNRQQSRGGTSARRVRLTGADVKALADPARASAISAVSPTVGASGTVTWDGVTYQLQNFIGAEPAFGLIRNIGITSGRWLDDEDNRARAKVAVIGTTVAEKLFGKGVNPVGEQLQFNGIRFRRIGQQDKKGSTGSGAGRRADRPSGDGDPDVAGNADSYTSILVQAVSRNQLPTAMAQVTSILRRSHQLRAGQPNDFRVFNAANLLAAGKAAAQQFQLLLAAVAGISLLIGGSG